MENSGDAKMGGAIEYACQVERLAEKEEMDQNGKGGEGGRRLRTVVGKKMWDGGRWIGGEGGNGSDGGGGDDGYVC